MSVKFPTTIINNFLDDPMGVREFALTLPYKEGPNYPGVRSDLLKNISPSFDHEVVNRFLKVFYNLKGKRYYWNCDVVFQRINKGNAPRGWIHRDPGTVTCVLYLNPEENKESGTIIYEPKNPVLLDPFKNRNTKHLSIEEREPFRKEHQEQFEETVILKNKFNRLIAFDGQMYHSANDLIRSDSEGDRLTMVMFLYDFMIQGENVPLVRMKNFG